MKIHALLIDCQNDFTDPNGSLFVKGADKDMDRLALMIRRLGNKLDDIHSTLDSHALMHIGNPLFWRNSNGKHPAPFTGITVSDVENGVWAPTRPNLAKHALDYVKALSASSRYSLTVWPPHCLIGDEGHCINKKVFEAFNEWETAKLKTIDMVTKGSNPLTEHYSIFKAEYEMPDDPTTQLNTRLVKTFIDADEVVVAGEASSHCVRNSVVDLANAFGDDSYVKKLVYLKDASSPVPGFEQFEEDFLREMSKRGMRISTTTEYLA